MCILIGLRNRLCLQYMLARRENQLLVDSTNERKKKNTSSAKNCVNEAQKKRNEQSKKEYLSSPVECNISYSQGNNAQLKGNETMSHKFNEGMKYTNRVSENCVAQRNRFVNVYGLLLLFVFVFVFVLLHRFLVVSFSVWHRKL